MHIYGDTIVREKHSMYFGDVTVYLYCDDLYYIRPHVSRLIRFCRSEVSIYGDKNGVLYMMLCICIEIGLQFIWYNIYVSITPNIDRSSKRWQYHRDYIIYYFIVTTQYPMILSLYCTICIMEDHLLLVTRDFWME